MPQVSIIIPCYNHGAYIKEAIESVEKCADKEVYEIIIINDGSTDAATIEILQQLASQGYNIVNQKNQGLGAARNNGIKLATGKYVLPLDSDNLIFTPYLTAAVDILDKDDSIAMLYGNADYFGEKNGIHHVGEYNLQKLMLCNYIDACAIYRKSVWQKHGGYSTDMPVMGFEDWDFILKLSFAGEKFYYLKETCFGYRVLSNSMLRSVNPENYIATRAYLENKYASYLNLAAINDRFIKSFKENKKMYLKLFMIIFFPGYLERLYKKGKIKSKDIIV